MPSSEREREREILALNAAERFPIHPIPSSAKKRIKKPRNEMR
jgi:hypothetical protein